MVRPCMVRPRLPTRFFAIHPLQVDKLNHIISEADAERFRQQREYDVVINERDILGTQLIRERISMLLHTLVATAHTRCHCAHSLPLQAFVATAHSRCHYDCTLSLPLHTDTARRAMSAASAVTRRRPLVGQAEMTSSPSSTRRSRSSATRSRTGRSPIASVSKTSVCSGRHSSERVNRAKCLRC